MNKKLNILVLADVPQNAELRQSETLYRLLTENIGDLVCLLDRKGNFLYASPSYRTSLDYAPESLIGRSAPSLVHPDDVASFSKAFLQGKAGRENPKAEVRYKHRSGEWRLFESVGSSILDEQGIPQSFVIVSRDVTERKMAEAQLKTSHEQLRALSARAHSTLESEKTRIAREIHDDFAQKLTALAIELSLLDSGFGDTGHELPTQELHAKIKNLYELADCIIKSARRIEAQLRPKVLDEFGLAAALDWQTREFQKETGIKCQFTALPEDLTLERNFSTEIFRIFQEILSNVARHANASQVVVQVAEREGQLSVEVRDNGKGINREQIGDPKSLGLLGMKERASLLSGTVQIEGATGSGTLVRVLAPVKRSEGRATGSSDKVK